MAGAVASNIDLRLDQTPLSRGNYSSIMAGMNTVRWQRKCTGLEMEKAEVVLAARSGPLLPCLPRELPRSALSRSPGR